ncbi:alcohol dehydrogenase [Emericellopsis cladophorae]|uniref:Alcohol dehydrogenase n=1 Tax=Emericellopsis cladophorae TaxID=2686198 RepID=A0A9P9XYD4_9HYPO|nr:alcohol dehydrogenase [Emericellopsis cladophorae]KAI6780117.1 alcohol dehydrogenase [Emericellopsis cladophorae]
MHTPLNAHTQDLMNKEASAAMKDGPRIINTARGQFVNEDTLIEALQSAAITTRINPELNAMKNIMKVVDNDGEYKGEPLTLVNKKWFQPAAA